MQKRMKVTGFARFFLVMIFVVPLAYLGASYYNGEDGIANIKHFLGLDKTEAVVKSETPAADIQPSESQDEAAMRKELEYQQKRMEELKKENERLRKEVYDKEQELSNLKNQ